MFIPVLLFIPNIFKPELKSSYYLFVFKLKGIKISQTDHSCDFTPRWNQKTYINNHDFFGSDTGPTTSGENEKKFKFAIINSAVHFQVEKTRHPRGSYLSSIDPTTRRRSNNIYNSIYIHISISRHQFKIHSSTENVRTHPLVIPQMVFFAIPFCCQ